MNNSTRVRLSAAKTDPPVSVILPVFNGAEYVGCALASVMLQNYVNVEIVVVNDGSTDGAEAILHAYATRDSRMRVVTQTNFWGIPSAQPSHCRKHRWTSATHAGVASCLKDAAMVEP